MQFNDKEHSLQFGFLDLQTKAGKVSRMIVQYNTVHYQHQRPYKGYRLYF